MRAIPHFASATTRLAMSKMLCIPIFIVYLSPELFLWNFDFDRSKNRIKQTEIYFWCSLRTLAKIFEVIFKKSTPKTCWHLICFLLNYFRKKSNSKNIFSSKKLSFFMFLFLMLLKNLVEKSKKIYFWDTRIKYSLHCKFEMLTWYRKETTAFFIFFV